MNTKITVQLDRQRTLLFDFNALARAEEQLGTQDNTLSREFWEHVNVRRLRALLWAGLLHEDPRLSIETVGGWLNVDNFGEVANKVAEAFQAAFPAPKAPDPARPEDPSHPTG